MAAGTPYFNAGVLLMNLAQWRADGLAERITEFLTRSAAVIRFADQDGMNALMNGRWIRLPAQYNLQAAHYEAGALTAEIEAAKRAPLITHYSGADKPWQLGNDHPLRQRYWHYLRRAGYRWRLPSDFTPRNIAMAILPRGIFRALQRLRGRLH